jgi:hypothetical protein
VAPTTSAPSPAADGEPVSGIYSRSRSEGVTLPSAFGWPVAGWMGMSELIGQSDPETGDIMRSCGYLISAVLEDEAQNLAHGLAEILNQTLPRSAIRAVEADLGTNTCPLTVSDAHQALEDAIADSGVDLDDANSWDPGSGLLRKIDKISIEAAADKLGKDPADLRAHWNSPGGWYLTASLDLPERLNNNWPVRCVRPAHRFFSDKLLVEETTYLDQPVNALENDHVTAGNIQQAYRPNLDGMLVDSYYESLTHGQVRCLYFTVKMIEARQNRLVRKLGNSIAEHHGAIIEAINSAVQAAIGVFAGYTALPVQQVARGLLNNASRPILERIISVLERSIADISLPSWVVTHTAAVGDRKDCVPLSIIQLYTMSSTGSVLHWAKQGPAGIAPSKHYEEDIGFNYSGRQMLGHSQPSGSCPVVLWSQVAELNNPVCWTQPEKDENGFRVLLPHKPDFGNASYISAVRADVILKPAGQKTQGDKVF